MAKRIWPGLLALVLALSGCASLLERDYSVVEPYADSYWDTEEDALRAESYQELVNSLLMLVEQRSEEGTIRFYTDSDAPYSQVVEASREVREETALGAYLVEEMSFLIHQCGHFGSRGGVYRHIGLFPGRHLFGLPPFGRSALRVPRHCCRGGFL